MLSNHDVISTPEGNNSSSILESIIAGEGIIHEAYRSLIKDTKDILNSLPNDKWAKECIKIIDDLSSLLKQDRMILHSIAFLQYLLARMGVEVTKLSQFIDVYKVKFQPTTDVVFAANVNTCNQLVCAIMALTKMVSKTALEYEEAINSYDSIVKNAKALRDKYIAIEDRIKFQGRAREEAYFRASGFTPVGIMSHTKVINSLLEAYRVVTKKLFQEFSSPAKDGELTRFSNVVSSFAQDYIQHLAKRNEGIEIAKEFAARVNRLKKPAPAAMYSPAAAASTSASVMVPQGITTTPMNQ